jgi:hypothetical protein
VSDWLIFKGVTGSGWFIIGIALLFRGFKAIRNGPMSARLYALSSGLLPIGLGLIQFAEAYRPAWVPVELTIGVLGTLIVLTLISWFFAGRAQKKHQSETP